MADRSATWPNQLCPAQGKRRAFLSVFTNPFRSLLRKGGLRLKLIGFITLIILTTVGTLDYFIIKLMEEAVSRKAFEVVETSLSRIGEVSRLALLERTYENKINLDEILQGTRASDIEGLLDIDIFATIKEEEAFEFAYFTGFDPAQEDSFLLDEHLRRRILAAEDEAVFRDSYYYVSEQGVVPAYRYVKPIFTNYQDKTHLLGTVVVAYSQDAIFGAVRTVIWISTFITLAILTVSIAIAYLLGSRFTRPMITMAEAASKVMKGDLNVRLEVSTNDEIEDLSKRFNDMVQGLKRKELMQKFLSSSTLDMIEKGDFCHLKLGGEHQTLTLLFSDIRGFTAICEGKQPQEVVAIVNFYLNLQASIIKRWGGDIDKFVGDEVMALFSGEDNIDRAINAAREIQQTIKKENQRRRKRGLITVEVGIGINNGEVVVGNVGSYDRMDFTAMGSVVNRAAKFCAVARPSEILVDKQTYRQSKGNHKVEQVGHLQADTQTPGWCSGPDILRIKG